MSNMVDRIYGALSYSTSLGERFIHDMKPELEEDLTASEMGMSDI